MHSLCITLTKYRCTCCWLQTCILLWPCETNFFAYGNCVLSKHTLFPLFSGAIAAVCACSLSTDCMRSTCGQREVMCEDVRRSTDGNTRTLKHEPTPPLLHQLMTVYNVNPELGRKYSLRLAGTWGEEAVLFRASGTKTLSFWR